MLLFFMFFLHILWFFYTFSVITKQLLKLIWPDINKALTGAQSETENKKRKLNDRTC